MTNSDNDRYSLLGYVARQHIQGMEDAMTSALGFVLNRFESARTALAGFLRDADGTPLSIHSVDTQYYLPATYSYPDMALQDADDNVSAFIEAKFWASLTHHQPVTYWEALPADKSTALLFVAPKSRVDENWLWDELVQRLSDAGHKLNERTGHGGLITATAKDTSRRLMLTSWERLLNVLLESASDAQETFEILQLEGLAKAAHDGGDPRRDENLIMLIEEAGKRLQQSGWAEPGSQNVGSNRGVFYGRFMVLAGVLVWLGIVDIAAKHMANPPLWLTIQPTNADQPVSRDTVVDKLGNLVKSKTQWHNWMTHCVAIPLPSGADREATLSATVTELERIAEIIDPDGPTYR
ncbi:MAG: hypothetical protein F4X20_09215 [Dehalococcoidia bacterium]|nr:hypothetical protein [Dehalococcoidia bacterium]